MDKKIILVIDDDAEFCGIIKSALEAMGQYEVKMETEGEQALAAVKKFSPGLILLDLVMPGVNGFKICKELKEKDRFASIPVIVLSGKHDEADKVACLDAGADDYVVKPFSMNELDSRIKAVLRRSVAKGPQDTINIGDSLILDLQKRLVTVDGEAVTLTATEFKMLELLASKKGQVFSRSRILDYLWDGEKGVVEQTVDVHIRHLREKLGKAADFIVNVRGFGYKVKE